MTTTIAAAPFLGRHGVHLLSLAGPAVALAVFAAWADLRARTGGRVRTPAPVGRTLSAIAAAFALVATAVHVRVAPEHFHEALVFGVFFVVTATCQLGWSALMLARPRMWTAVAGGVGNGAVLALWAYTRAVSVPIGPDAGRPEEIGALDIVATAAEAAVVVLVIAIVVRAMRASRRSLPGDQLGEATGEVVAATEAAEQGPARIAAGAQPHAHTP